MSNKSGGRKNERDRITPSVHEIHASPETALEAVNKFGTYEIQPTADTQNAFPEIRQGLPSKTRDKCAPDGGNSKTNKENLKNS